jgi:hypothetical protein
VRRLKRSGFRAVVALSTFVIASAVAVVTHNASALEITPSKRTTVPPAFQVDLPKYALTVVEAEFAHDRAGEDNGLLRVRFRNDSGQDVGGNLVWELTISAPDPAMTVSSPLCPGNRTSICKIVRSNSWPAGQTMGVGSIPFDSASYVEVLRVPFDTTFQIEISARAGLQPQPGFIVGAPDAPKRTFTFGPKA